jgi:general secretion pathway protein K
LTNLFIALGLVDRDIATMVDSILDWRSGGETPRPHGAKSDYYLRLDPPYPAKNGKFEVVEELAWVHGFEDSPFLARLSDWLTVQPIGQAVNINTASLEVLVASGLSADVARQVLDTRQTAPFQNLQGLPPVMADPSGGPAANLMVQSSPFFTIKSTGRVKRNGARHTIKAVVRIIPNSENLWDIISWIDDFPG